ncbi:hypothetical protein IN07_07530 [Modestobacter caceresii]|uniref:ABC transporter permease n=1 Tax=Modestobacter caceresii TaxID=1522368 RepID=A0A098Y9U1_9ACTN|nr:hypothetical protein IN07_07530 [Modestobacter caceresii]
MVVLAAALLLPVLAYTLTVLVPFATSDLDELPLPELAAGALAPGWPHSGALDLAGVAALVLVLLGALLSLGGAALQLLALLPADRRTLTPWVAAALALVAVGSVATLYWFLSPLGSALTSWQLD